MSTFYDLLALNEEVMALHKKYVGEVPPADEANTVKLIEILGGIDYILAYFLQQNMLNAKQLVSLKSFLSKNEIRAPSVEEMAEMLDEIDEEQPADSEKGDHEDNDIAAMSEAAENAEPAHAPSNLAVMKCEHGHSQSPINLVSEYGAITQKMDDTEFSNSPLTFNYPSQVSKCCILNNGHTVQINIDDSQKCSLTIKGKTYYLKQFHFHTPSEHTIDGKQYEMEMHLVHLNEDNEIAVLGFIFTTQQKYKKATLKLSKSRAHLVLNAGKAKSDAKENKKVSNTLQVMGNEDETSDDLETDDELAVDNDGGKGSKMNDFLAQFWDYLPSSKTDNDILLQKSLSFDSLFESSSNNFKKNVDTNEINIDMEIFEYMGSLTTPPYTEGVQWLVSKRTHYINEEQLKRLSACWNNENNAREVQKYFGRTISMRSQSSLLVVQ
eukprot:CAMPEP_0197047438 /NCGR_PEP_ID=MMETSP1384-20130603/22950_1 /TAXON_ID=29189 /ORGANISM="Ammonia sp." /LENGTH=437 /DNA_ID=CAMNT_0042479357 /DNA_START=45 /DNA_END=1358 /DNA_ORIENTATION=+